MLKRTIAVIISAFILCTGTSVFAEEQSAANTDDVSYGDFLRAPYLSDVLSEREENAGLDTITLSGTQGNPNGTASSDIVGESAQAVLIWDENASEISWEFDVNSSGRYMIEMSYFLPGNTGSNAVRNLKLDGETPFFEADNIVFYRRWADSGDVTVNSIGDEVRPGVAEQKVWQTEALYDSSGYYAAPLIFWLESGRHTLTLTYVSQTIAIDTLTIKGYTPPEDYQKVAAAYPKTESGKEMITFQAEDVMTVKNDATIRLESNADPATVPIAYGNRVFNTVGGYRWRKGGQEVSFEIEVPKEGLYQIALRVSQTWNDGMPAYRTIMIDGKVPFAELQNYRFEYHADWQTVTLGGDTPYLFYLSGKHTVTMRVTMGEITSVVQSLYGDMSLLSENIRQITQLAGNDPDPNYDYQFFKYIPNLKEDMQSVVKSMKQKAELVNRISGKTTAMESNFKSIAKEFEGMLNDPFSIARKSSQITQAQTSLGNWFLEIQSQPLLLDEITLAPEGQTVPHRKSSLFMKLRSAVKSFITSFVKDYDNLASVVSSDVEIKETINVWIARGSEWAEIIKEMADESFTPKSGTLVNINVVPSNQLNTGSANALLLAITSKTAPDVAMGVAANSPVEFAIRDAVVDLTSFSDYGEVKSRFLDKILIPFGYNGGVYALPETMNFSCLFYRKDILSEYNLSLPDTRQQLYHELLPELYQNGMLYYQNQDFTQFLFQYGGAFYTADGLKSGLDSVAAYKAFKEYTEMFTQYGSPFSANFFNRFRTGEMPVGIGNYAQYIQLCTAAPELLGKWGIAPLPGILREDGVIDRSSGGISAECDIILSGSSKTKQAASWEFLKWWTSDDVQMQYAKEIEALVGVEARWNTANINAFESLDWNSGDLEVFREGWKWATETPVVLGGYFTNRYVVNAFTSVVVSGDLSVRDALENAVKEINRELKKKQEEYGVYGNK